MFWYILKRCHKWDCNKFFRRYRKNVKTYMLTMFWQMSLKCQKWQMVVVYLLQRLRLPSIGWSGENNYYTKAIKALTYLYAHCCRNHNSNCISYDFSLNWEYHLLKNSFQLYQLPVLQNLCTTKSQTLTYYNILVIESRIYET